MIQLSLDTIVKEYIQKTKPTPDQCILLFDFIKYIREVLETELGGF